MAVKLHFLDSGAFAFKRLSIVYQEKHGCDRWAYYRTKAFRKILDQYGKFVKKYELALDYYANVDVIGNDKLSWRNQRYLEDKWRIKPVPVLHMGCKKKVLRFYLEQGYDYIGLGGMAGEKGKQLAWLTQMFSIICDTPDKKPSVKVHGFGVGDFKRMYKYPWHSVDSTNWFRVGSFGCILMPEKKNGKYRWDTAPIKIVVSEDSPKVQNGNQSVYGSKSQAEKQRIREWLDYIGIPLGDEGEGVMNWYAQRTRANLLYYEHLRKNMPGWPRPDIDEDLHAYEDWFF